MNKNAKGAIAVGAATVLLLGGGGTLAVWNASDQVTGGSIYSGQLSLAGGDTAEGTWYFYDGGKGTDCADSVLADEVPNPASYTLVPGDNVIFCVDGLELSAQGGELYFTIGEDAGSVTVTDVNDQPVSQVTYEAADIFVTSGITPDVPGAVSVTAAGYEQYTAAAFVPEFDDVYGVTALDGLVTIPLSAYIHVDMSDYQNIVDGQQWKFTLGGDSGVSISQVIKLF